MAYRTSFINKSNFKLVISQNFLISEVLLFIYIKTSFKSQECIKKANAKEKYVSKYWTLAFLFDVIENFEKFPFHVSGIVILENI